MARITGNQATAMSSARLHADRRASFLVPGLSPGISPETPRLHPGGRMSHVITRTLYLGGRGRHCAVAAILAIGLLTVMPGAYAAASPQDLRSPDGQDAAASSAAVSGVDLRSPDARDAGSPAPQVVPAASNDS